MNELFVTVHLCSLCDGIISLEVYFERLECEIRPAKVYEAAKHLSEIVPELKALDNYV